MKTTTRVALWAVVMTLLLGVGSALGQSLYSNGEFSRRQGNASLSGQVLVDTISTSVDVWPSQDPKPGNIGRWQLMVQFRGSFLKNITKDGDIQFALDNPRHSLMTFSTNILQEHEEEWDGEVYRYVSFDPVFRTEAWVHSHLYDNGDGKGVQGAASISTDNLWNNSWVDLNVMGGSITDLHIDIDRNSNPNGIPGINFSDWDATMYFSGVVEADTFTVGITPEPTSLALLGLAAGPLMCRLCRRRA